MKWLTDQDRKTAKVLRHSILSDYGQGAEGLQVLAQCRQGREWTLWTAQQLEALGDVLISILRECELEQVGYWLKLIVEVESDDWTPAGDSEEELKLRRV